ncbi:MAG: GTPase [Candidatus Hydrogenedentes bacterium]|nr:GTPase [Candidatus Hydrogenedentota bacterium]
MPKTRKLPLVAICGRPNVGKSTLFNRMTGRQRAIVHDEEGITRDRCYAAAEWDGRAFRVVDTGGIVENPMDSIVQKMQEQIRVALKEARVIVFVVDGQQEITRIDEELCQELFRYGKPVVLAVNKLDNPNMFLQSVDFYSLGIGEPIAISSGHGLGMDELMAAILAHLPPASEDSAEIPEEDAEEKPHVTKVAVIGKPNTGKSSFVNALLNEERNIVDATPGTTRDAIDIDFHWQDKDYLLIDTAGMRKKAGITRKVELFSVTRSLKAVRRADVCLVMIDATEGISEQDKRILGYCHENGAAMIMVWTKWDLIEDKVARFKAIADEIDLKVPFAKYVPYTTVSNVTRQRLFKTFELIDQVAAMAEKRISTAEFNKLMEAIRQRNVPASHKGKTAKILYGTQTAVKPTTFILFVNQKRLFHFSYLRFIENQIREMYGFEGVPITIELREGKPKS